MVATIVAIMAIELALIVWRLGGHFSYTLDDPYIHLALADRIAQGHYGLNAGEPSSPSSSILFPFILAGLSVLGIGQFAPLLINGAATMASGLLLCAILRSAVPTERLPAATLALLGTSIVLSLNLVGLALTGLEHSLHVAVTLGCLFGALRFLQSGRIAPWWWLCALAEPLVRYEGASLWIGTAALLLLHRRFVAGAMLILLGAPPLVGFSVFLHQLGLPLLPSSVLVKSDAAMAGTQFSGAGFASSLLGSLTENLHAFAALRLLVLCGLLGLMIWRGGEGDPARRRLSTALGGLALFVSLAHCVLGRFGWFSRYEIYVLALDAAVLSIGFGPWLADLLLQARPARLIIAALVPMAFGSVYVQTTIQSYKASWAIYAQQYQMHRLATGFYGKPVAVNDLGWAAYENRAYVLDLWGLGSEAARRARKLDPSGRWMASLAREHDVGLAMIYASWFDALPAEWRAVARLSHDGPSLFDDKVVTLYATGPDRVAGVEAALAAFGRSLPSGVALEMIEPPSPEASLP